MDSTILDASERATPLVRRGSLQVAPENPDVKRKQRRILWGQRGLISSIIIWCIFRFTGRMHSGYLRVVLYFIPFLSFWVFFCLVASKNFSRKVLMALIRQPKLWLVVMNMILFMVVDMWGPVSQFDHDAHNILLRLIIDLTDVSFFLVLILLDAVRVKSRRYILMYGTLVVAYMIAGIVKNTLTVKNSEWIRVAGNSIYTNAMFRSIYITIMSLLFDGLLTLFTDSKMEKLMFVKDNVYHQHVHSVPTRLSHETDTWMQL